MAIEIERKFLVKNDDWRQSSDAGVAIAQGYFGSPQKASIRVRIQGNSANINIKSARLGISRHEYEYAIPLEDARHMLDELCVRPVIEKHRYHCEYQGHIWEIDVFEGDNAGLVVAEIELGDENETFAIPDWAGEDVSHDPRYYNVSLLKHPFKEWD